MSSSYYWSMYRQKKQEAAKYGKQIKELTDIRKRLSNDFEDDVENVNGTLKKCSESKGSGRRNSGGTTWNGPEKNRSPVIHVCLRPGRACQRRSAVWSGKSGMRKKRRSATANWLWRKRRRNGPPEAGGNKEPWGRLFSAMGR